MRNGLFTNFHRNGNISSQCIYKDDCIDGLYQQFDENFQLVREERYINGVKLSL